jgi:zinc transporter ZupT
MKIGSRRRLWFYYLMLFACTFIACTGINHVLPNAVDAFDAFSLGWGYPYPGVICTFSLMLCWALDVMMDRRKKTTQVTDYVMVVETEDDLPPANPYLFSGAMCSQSLLEGLVLGAAPVQHVDTNYVYVIMGVLAAHKCAEGFSLSLVYAAYEYEFGSQLVLLCLYAVLTPIGLVIGLLVEGLSFSGPFPLVAGILSAASAAVFIYAGLAIIVSRIVPMQAKTNWRYLFVIAGWAASSAISWFA